MTRARKVKAVEAWGVLTEEGLHNCAYRSRDSASNHCEISMGFGGYRYAKPVRVRITLVRKRGGK